MKNVLLCTVFAALVFNLSGSAYAVNYTKVEHLNGGENSKSNIVNISKTGSVIRRENVLKAAFSENFNSKYYKKGDMVQFTFADDIKTEEGTLIIPKNSNLIGAIADIEKPKAFSRNAKVSLDFMYILLPDGKRLPCTMELANGKGYLKAGAKETAGKIAAYTLGIGGTGAGLGAAIGTASSNTIPGLIIGGSIGGGVGLITGIATPGLHYKAKKGFFIPLRLEENLSVPNL